MRQTEEGASTDACTHADHVLEQRCVPLSTIAGAGAHKYGLRGRKSVAGDSNIGGLRSGPCPLGSRARKEVEQYSASRNCNSADFDHFTHEVD